MFDLLSRSLRDGSRNRLIARGFVARVGQTIRSDRSYSEAPQGSCEGSIDYVLALLEVERDVRSLVEELELARTEISQLRCEVSSLRV